MIKAFDWIKTHKLLTFNLLLLTFFVFLFVTGTDSKMSTRRSAGPIATDYLYETPTKSNFLMESGGGIGNYPEAAPQPDVEDRMVITNSNFSLLVKNVVETQDQIKNKAVQISGYVISSDLRKLENSEEATIQIRVPSDKVEEISKYLRSIAVKVVSENVTGKDITDQYMDIERRLADLESQRSKMQTIMNSAITVSDMMEVQRGLFQVQDQIDSYKGRMIYLDGVTKTSKLIITISTDELSLPYAPANLWEPQVIFKQAVRSMLGILQNLGSFAIWLVVYLPIIIIIVIAYKLIRKVLRRGVK